MRKSFPGVFFVMIVAGLVAGQVSHADPAEDRQAMLDYFAQRFPDVPLAEYANGVYAFDQEARAQWLEMEDFPPYEIAIEDGENYFNVAFSNGNSYASCFENGGIGIRQNYPYFDDRLGEVVTLELAINQCRERNDEPPLPFREGELAAISAYMAYTSRGNILEVRVPQDNAAAVAAWEMGRQFYYARRGQLNFACSSCHVQSAGLLLRANTLSPTVGQMTHWPVYRAKWGDIGTLHKRFAECNSLIRARPFDAQGIEYKNLEYYLAYMSNGLELNGPATRQ